MAVLRMRPIPRPGAWTGDVPGPSLLSAIATNGRTTIDFRAENFVELRCDRFALGFGGCQGAGSVGFAALRLSPKNIKPHAGASGGL